MLKKHIVLTGIIIALLLLTIAVLVYPGGSAFDPNSTGFDLSKNYISNLFSAKAINGADNKSRVWADAGMIFLSISFALFFIHFSEKIPKKGAANVIKYIGAGNMLFTFLIVTPLHDLMVTLAATFFLVSLFYITVFILRSKLHVLKCCCVAGMLIFYYTLFLYGAGPPWKLLPIMQKVNFISVTLLVIALEYGTAAKDFEAEKTRK